MDSLQYVFHGNDVFKAGTEIVGGKGWSLARLERYGFNVPQGCVLSAQAYECFLRENGLLNEVEKISEDLNITNISQKENIKIIEELRAKIEKGTMPKDISDELIIKLTNLGLATKPLAIRSSATMEDSKNASFAGIHESYLNIFGIEQITDSIKKCYASLWTAKAVAYRRKMEIKDSDVLQAVVITEMVPAVAAGVAFTCDPVTGRRDIIVINATLGLGEALVSGMVEPDEYMLSIERVFPLLVSKKIGKKEGMTLPNENGGTKYVNNLDLERKKQALADEQISSLALIVQRVFESLGETEHHQDIEWVFDGMKFFLVQSRPVTVIPKYTFPQLKGQPEIWSNANMKDAMPMVQSISGWTFVQKLSKSIITAPFRITNYQALPGVQYNRLFQGRGYFNLSAAQWTFFDAFGISPKEINETGGGHQPEIDIPIKEKNDKQKKFQRNWRKLKLLKSMMKTQNKAKEIFIDVSQYNSNLAAKNFGSMSDAQLINEFDKNLKKALEFTETVAMLTNFSGLPLMFLSNLLNKYFPAQGTAMTNKLVLGQAKITSAEQGYCLIKMAEVVKEDPEAQKFFALEPFKPNGWQELSHSSKFKQAFINFLEEYGHRGVYEGDVRNPRWREEPAYLLNTIKDMIEFADSDGLLAKQQSANQKAWQEINEKVPFMTRGFTKWLVKKVIKTSELREEAKSILVKFAEPSRKILFEMGIRLSQRGILEHVNDIFHCSWSEIVQLFTGQWEGEGIKILVKERKEKLKAYEQLDPPDLVIDEIPQSSVSQLPLEGTKYLTGLGVSAGSTKGTAKLLSNPAEADKLNYQDVLVAPTTDPGWTPLFLKASAIVMETGGYLSHGAIVAREYGIPAVVNVLGVTKIIKDGDEIIVDGDEGKLYFC